MVDLEPFKTADFDLLISWIDSKELLLQIAGPYFSFPLTTAQLVNYMEDKSSLAFNITEPFSNKIIGHAEIILLGNNVCKLDKILIGDKSRRGKGIGQQVVNRLLAFSFDNLGAEKVMLYVFDWNTSAIRCYEKNGFVVNEDAQMFTDSVGTIWKAFKMTIEKEKWLSLQ